MRVQVYFIFIYNLWRVRKDKTVKKELCVLREVSHPPNLLNRSTPSPSRGTDGSSTLSWVAPPLPKELTMTKKDFWIHISDFVSWNKTVLCRVMSKARPVLMVVLHRIGKMKSSHFINNLKVTLCWFKYGTRTKISRYFVVNYVRMIC